MIASEVEIVEHLFDINLAIVRIMFQQSITNTRYSRNNRGYWQTGVSKDTARIED